MKRRACSATTNKKSLTTPGYCTVRKVHGLEDGQLSERNRRSLREEVQLRDAQTPEQHSTFADESPGKPVDSNLRKTIIRTGKDVPNNNSEQQQRSLRDTGRLAHALVVRVLAYTDQNTLEQPRRSRSELYQKAFVESRKQFLDCSGQKFRMDPYPVSMEADGTTNQGVIEVTLDQPLAWLTSSQNRILAQEKVCEYFHLGKQLCDLQKYLGIDLLLFVMPAGTLDGGSYGRAFANPDDTYSVYVDSTTGVSLFEPEVILHEIAHNYNVGHSESDADTVGPGDFVTGLDNSGIMGANFVFAGNADERCFNGFNYYVMGWHEDKTLAMPIGTTGLFRLSSITEIDKIPDSNVVVIKYGDYFISWNYWHEFNKETPEYLDKVMVVKRLVFRQRGFYTSYTEAALDPEGSDISIDGAIYIRVCGWNRTPDGVGDYVKIAIGDGSMCNSEDYGIKRGASNVPCALEGQAVNDRTECCSLRWRPSEKTCLRVPAIDSRNCLAGGAVARSRNECCSQRWSSDTSICEALPYASYFDF